MREFIAKTVAVAAVFGVVALSTQAFSIQEPDVGASAQVSAGDHHPDTVIAPQRERRVGVSRYGRGNEFRTAWFGERPESAGRDQEMRSAVRAAKGTGCDHVCRAEKRDAEMEADFFETGAAERGCRRMHKAGGDCGVGDTYWLVMR